MLIEGNKNVRKAKIIPKDVIDNFLILKGSSSSLSKSLRGEPKEDSSLNWLFVMCFDFVLLKNSQLLNFKEIIEHHYPTYLMSINQNIL